MPKSHVVEFTRLATIPEPRPVKATLRADVRVSVQRSIDKLPVLGQRNPDAALLIERSIDDWMPPPDDDDGLTQPMRIADTDIALECIRQLRGYLESPVHQQLMDMLRDMGGDLAAAS